MGINSGIRKLQRLFGCASLFTTPTWIYHHPSIFQPSGYLLLTSAGNNKNTLPLSDSHGAVTAPVLINWSRFTAHLYSPNKYSLTVRTILQVIQDELVHPCDTRRALGHFRAELLMTNENPQSQTVLIWYVVFALPLGGESEGSAAVHCPWSWWCFRVLVITLAVWCPKFQPVSDILIILRDRQSCSKPKLFHIW